MFLLVVSYLALTYQGGGTASEHGTVAASQSAIQTDAGTANSPTSTISVDKLAAANAVTNLAETTNLPTAGDLREATTTLEIKKQLSQSDAEVIAKPQIVNPETSAKRGITSYVTKQGDTMESIAKKFKISAQTLRWANNTVSDAVDIGKTLTVPLTDGVVYTVKDGDTVQSVAEKYKVNADRVVLYNDLEAGAALAKDTKLVLPNGDLPETERPGYVAPRSNRYGGVGAAGGSATLGSSYNHATASVGNRYAAGNCTWYVYERRAAMGRPIGSFWGNAYSWAASARAAGFLVDKNPTPGSIFQTSSGGGGYGHVGMVERVDGQNIYVSDMNYGGYNVITHRTIPISQAGAYNYIH